MGKLNFNEKKNSNFFYSSRKRSVRIDYIIKNVSSSHVTSSSLANSIFGKFVNDCISYQAHSVYLIEPRLSNREIYEALQKAWRQSNSQNSFFL